MAKNSKIDQALLKKKDKILELRNTIKEQSRTGKSAFEKEWYQKILFYVGKQWIMFDKQRKEWVEMDLDEWYPRPVTNKFAVGANALKSLIGQNQPRIIVTPATDSEEDIATAEIGDTLVDVLETESENTKARKIAGAWFILTGNFFYHNFYYTDQELGTVFIPFEQCTQCQTVSSPDQIENDACPNCKAQSSMTKAVGSDGNEIGAEIPRGRLKVEAVPPFEMFFNQELQDFDNVRELVRAKRKPISELKELYPEIADSISPDKGMDHQSEMYAKSLAYMTNTGYAQGIRGVGLGVIENGTVDYLISLPKADFPQGLMATIVGNEIVELSDMENYQDIKGRYFIPIVHAPANIVPGRMYGKTRMDDVVEKQIQRNTYESFIQLAFLTMAGGKWLDPGTNMDDPTGDPNQVISYDWTVNGREPKLQKGIDPSGVWIELIRQIDAEIEDLIGTVDVLKGQLPAGLDTFSGLRLLTEKAVSVHGEMIENWEIAHEKNKKIQLEIARKHFVEMREKTFKNENGSWETKQFNKADLQGGLDIKVERGSAVAKSQAVENASIIDDVKLGLIDGQDPKVNLKILEKQGLADLASGTSEDIKDAMREWKDFLDSVISNPLDPSTWILRPRLGIDNEAIHYKDAVSRAKSSEFFYLPPEAQQIWIEHAQVHKANLDAEMAQQAMTQAPQPQPMKPSNNGKVPVAV